MEIKERKLLEGLNEIKLKDSPAKSLKAIADFFAEFKLQKAKESVSVREDEYYTSIHNLYVLLDSKSKPTSFYLYDKMKYCMGCNANCNRVNNMLELRIMPNEESINNLFGDSVGCPHELTRNLLMGFDCGYEQLEIRTMTENYPEPKREAMVEFAMESRIRKETDYEKTLELVNTIRGLKNEK